MLSGREFGLIEEELVRGLARCEACVWMKAQIASGSQEALTKL